MAKCMLAQTATVIPMDHWNWLWSEKLDGMRVLWDGGVTRGQMVRNVPWANWEKTPAQGSMRATGLWSGRQWKPIFAPDWWLDQLPPVALDGELWLGYGTFQTLMTRVRGYSPSFDGVQLWVIDTFGCDVFDNCIKSWQRAQGFWECGFEDISNTTVQCIPQAVIGDDIMDRVEGIIRRGGEGIVLRRKGAPWTATRSKWLLKMKPFMDGQAVVIGYTEGKGRLEGMVGALIVRDCVSGHVFNLSGLTDYERSHPPDICATIRYKYRELTDNGVPKEARYWR